MHKTGKPEVIENVLGFVRWIVILGDPGSAKTTLLRWNTLVFAEAASRGEEKVDFKGYCHVPVRIPILIQIGEFTSWFSQHQTKH
ncbi:unnamed protein product [Rotaria sp. Silwood1]|nr:unnamed protein product [Rotaria sp. Silwood1]CAF4908409.1 unnamed protein product [Rotaria sp. Silwood1]CAF4988227.1 unnamed protein product [Rotaria sp. Silwood1]